MLASRPISPWLSTISRYQAWMRCEIAMMEKRWPSSAAVASADSVMPSTGTGRASRRPARPGSPKAATITASWPAWCSAASCAVA